MVSCFASVMLMKLKLGLLKASWWSSQPTTGPLCIPLFLLSHPLLSAGWRCFEHRMARACVLSSGAVRPVRLHLSGVFFISAQILLAGWLKKSTIVCLCVLSFSSSSARVSYRSRTFKKIYFIKMHSTIVCTKLIHSQKDERCNLF